ncbi:MAG TPA: hypothetical protein GXZ47_04790 [Treponema sp.]|nr:hypothetical protein [Treponema sp.]
MSFFELFALLKKIILSPEVIIITIIIALYMNLVLYIVRYRKKSFRAKKPWRKVIRKGSEPILTDAEDDEDDDDYLEDDE